MTAHPHKDRATGVLNIFKDASAVTANYTGPIGLEYYPTQESAASVALIRELAAAA